MRAEADTGTGDDQASAMAFCQLGCKGKKPMRDSQERFCGAFWGAWAAIGGLTAIGSLGCLGILGPVLVVPGSRLLPQALLALCFNDPALNTAH